MSKNKSLNKAKNTKNDEFYTLASDIENEVKHYKHHFKDKVVFLNCDDPEKSQFWQYFSKNFKHLGLKKLIATHYNPSEPTYMLELYHYNEDPIKTKLKGNGDFRNSESISLLEESNIVITNPPFSIFREYLDQLFAYKKKFLIIGSKDAVTYKNVFKAFKENNIWIGYNSVTSFLVPSGDIKNVGAIWFTNLDIDKKNEKYPLYKKYDPNEYEKYDNFDAIHVEKAKDIPIDYEGLMGVPYSFLKYFNHKQFELVGMSAYSDEEYYGVGQLYIKGKKKFSRIVIRRR